MTDRFRLAAWALAVAPAAAAPTQEGPKDSADSVKLVAARTLGATVDTVQFIDAAATADGRRAQFDPIPEGTAFEVWLEGRPPRRVYVTEPVPDQPDATQQVQKPFVSVLRIPDAEWDEYLAFLKKDAPPGDDMTFKSVIVNALLEQKALLLSYRDEMANIEQRAAPARQKLSRGVAFKQVVRVHSEDQTSAYADGILSEEARGGLLDEYPLSKVVFELEPGQATGPIYTKHAVYLLRMERLQRASTTWFDTARVSAVVFRYTTGPNAPSRGLAEIKNSVRVRTDERRFKILLAAGIQVPPPETVGPDDIAPLGQPDAPLKRVSDGP